MAWGISGGVADRRTKIWVVDCKRCQRRVPAGIDAYPKDNIVVRCCLCAELRRYRPTEVYLGLPHGQVN